MDSKNTLRPLKRPIAMPGIFDRNYLLSEQGLYVSQFDNIPDIICFENINHKRWIKFITSLKKRAWKHFIKKDVSGSKGKVSIDEENYFLEEDVLINYSSDNKRVCMMWRNTSAKVIGQLIIGISKTRRVKKPKNSIKLILETKYGLDTEDFKIQTSSATIEESYNDDFLSYHELICKRLNTKNDKGIVLLHGLPGTGKTSYIRWLVKSLKKNIIFLPPHMAGALSQPSFIKFLMENKNSIFVIEDAEKILIDRNQVQDSPVSTILNISDGFLADILNIQIICSFNTDLTKIDKALLRRGRLITKYEFGKLETAKANELSTKLGFCGDFTTPQLLTDIYNQEETVVVSEPKVIVFW
jgi:hypothetical protein